MLRTKMPSVKDMHIVKIAVEPITPDLQPQLIEFDQRQPLSTIISDLCANWNLTDSENYALKYSEPICEKYVTEKNRNDVKNGSVLKLKSSATKSVKEIIKVLDSGTSIEHNRCLTSLSLLSSDPTFAIEFIKEQGLDLLIRMIEDGKCGGEKLDYALKSFVELMDHGTISWDILSESFIDRNITFINNAKDVVKEVIESSLSILENIVQNSSKYNLVENNVTFDNLLKLLQDSSTQVIQQNAIALINALFMKADEIKRKAIATTFSTKQYRSVILSNVLNANIGTEMTHQLSVLQSLTLGLLEPRMNTKNIDQDAQDKIKELRRIAFEGEGVEGSDMSARRQNNSYSVHYKKLGFKFDINPAQDFMESPGPGLLALDCMIYFARNSTQSYTKVVHENSCRADEHECPFGKTSIELVKVLCEILRIGEPFEQGKDFHPMFFTHDHPFEEFFCICIVILNKTWKDMRATNEDFAKVFSVVREQITRILSARPRDLDTFRIKINELTYAKITALRQQERTSREECESTASAIVSLKEKIRPEIIALIREQRLGYLVEGTRFSKFTRGVRSKDKFWYVRLSPNHKVLHYGDCDEKTVPMLEELKNKLVVNEIKQLLVGRECPHFKEMKGRKPPNLFSITFDSGEQQTLDFVAPDDITFYYWIDGVSCLLDQTMTSKQKDEDFETLLSMEIKLRLLDTEGVDISKDPPPIPEDPESYDFCFES